MKPHSYFANLVKPSGRITPLVLLKGIAIHDTLRSSFDRIQILSLHPKVVFWNHPLILLVRQNVITDVPFTQHLSHIHNLHLVFKKHLLLYIKANFSWLYRFCPWIAHTNLLAKYHRATVQEERQVTHTPKFGPEAFHL